MSSRTDLIDILGPLADVAMPHLQGVAFVTREGMAAANTAHDAELDTAVLAPGVELFGYQRAAVVAVEQTKRAIVGDDMGLGKTLIAITVLARNEPFPAVVVVPPSLVLNWVKEFTKFAPSLTVHAIRGKKNYELPQADVYVIGDAVVSAWETALIDLGPRALVVDEGQRMKSKTAQRAKAVKNIARWIDPNGYRMILSGTIIKNDRPDELIMPLQILAQLDPTFGDVYRYLDTYYPKVGRWDRVAQNMDELHKRLVDTCMIRVAYDDVRYQIGAEDLSQPIRLTPSIELSGKAADDYKVARDELRRHLNEHYTELLTPILDNEDDVAYAVEERVGRSMRAKALVQLNRLRMLIGEAKTAGVVQYVRDLVEDDEQVIVFANHRNVVEKIAGAFNAPTIMGGDDVRKVEAGKELFQSGAAKVIVLNIEAGGTGHTLTAGRHVVFAEFGWTPSDMTQAEARSNRIGQTRQVYSHWTMGANGEETIDERLVSILNRKSKVTSTILDGRETEMVEVDTLGALMDWARS